MNDLIISIYIFFVSYSFYSMLGAIETKYCRSCSGGKVQIFRIGVFVSIISRVLNQFYNLPLINPFIFIKRTVQRCKKLLHT